MTAINAAIATAAAMHDCGRRLADVLVAGDLVILTGPLGAGKTALTQGIGAGLGVRGAVVSPTFVIARTHPGGRVPLVHVDAYRLESLAEVEDMDLDISQSVTVVEWGSGLVDQLADSRLNISITRQDESEVRQLEFLAIGPGWQPRLTELHRIIGPEALGPEAPGFDGPGFDGPGLDVPGLG